ncbi:MAG: hypothetical protein EXX96DRAFT_575006 [Benjaminiella poitrasii]|nr:MAG: hypothetical protein EXX96DRAFT_575006 [Benjaminiella poitrasii]
MTMRHRPLFMVILNAALVNVNYVSTTKSMCVCVLSFSVGTVHRRTHTYIHTYNFGLSPFYCLMSFTPFLCHKIVSLFSVSFVFTHKLFFCYLFFPLDLRYI